MPTKQRPLKVFLSHAHSDKNAVRKLYLRLTKDGIDAWLDKEKLLPGQDWELEVRKAVHESHVVVVCLSKQFNRAGFRQKEVRLALDTAMEKPDGEIFIIPARLEECDTLESLHKWHRVDLYEEGGYENLIRALRARADKIGAHLEVQGDVSSNGITTFPESIEQYHTLIGTVLRASGENQSSIPLPPSANHTPKADDRGSMEDKSKRNSKLDPAIIAAIITVLGAIIVALISLYANRQSTLPTKAPSAIAAFTSTTIQTTLPTETNAPAEPTFTPVPPTDTAVPTPTGVPPAPLGEDWIAGCISTLWSPYPANVPAQARGDGCWNEPIHVFSAENGDLDFLAQKRNPPAEIYGLFAPLPEQGKVTITIRLRDLNNVDIWMAIFAEPDIESEGLLMIIPAGDVRRRVFVQKDVSQYETINSTSMLSQGNGFSISFSFNENSASSTVNPSVFVTSPVSIPSSKKWLFLGYKGLGGSYRVDGTFLSFELK